MNNTGALKAVEQAVDAATGTKTPAATVQIPSVITVSRVNMQSLIDYAQETNVTVDRLANRIIAEALVHFLHGAGYGITRASKASMKGIDQAFDNFANKLK